MSDADAELKNQISTFLRSQGRTVREIPRAASKTPDLIVDENTPDAVALELKSKLDDPTEMNDLAAKLALGGIVGRSKPTNAWNRLDALFSAAIKQLKTLDPTHQLHRVVWFHCVGLDSQLNDLRLRATLYGSQKLISTEIENVITAYYFWNSVFFRQRNDLDGVVISCGESAQLQLNEHSPRFSALAGSPFTQAFGQGVFFPGKYVTEPDVMISDFAGERSDAKPTLEYLRTKYRLDHLQTIDLGMESAMMNRPDA